MESPGNNPRRAEKRKGDTISRREAIVTLGAAAASAAFGGMTAVRAIEASFQPRETLPRPKTDASPPAPEAAEPQKVSTPTIGPYLTEEGKVEINKTKAEEFRKTIEVLVKDKRLGLQENPQMQKQFAQMYEAIVYVESQFNDLAGVNHLNRIENGAFGAGQITGANAKEIAKKYNIPLNFAPLPLVPGSIFNRETNTLIGLLKLKETYRNFPRYDLTSAVYNWGEGPVIEGISIVAPKKVVELAKSDPNNLFIRDHFKGMNEDQIKAKIEKDFETMTQPTATAFYSSQLDIGLEDISQDPDSRKAILEFPHMDEKGLKDVKRYVLAATNLGYDNLVSKKTVSWVSNTTNVD